MIKLESIGAFLNTEKKTLCPMNSDGTPDLDPGMEVDLFDADLYEIWNHGDERDLEIINSFLS